MANTEEKIRTNLVNKAVTLAVKAGKDYREKLQAVVELLGDMTRAEQAETSDRLVAEGYRISHVKRMVVCANRGLFGSWHLYSPVQLVHAATIRDADSDALKQIANPEEDLTYVDDNLKMSVIQVCNMRPMELSRAWDSLKGVVSPQKQRNHVKRLRSSMNEPLHPSGRVLILDKIVSALVDVTKDGEKVLTLSAHEAGTAKDTTHEIALPVSQLRKFMR